MTNKTITLSALIKRINRRLRQSDESLCTTRSGARDEPTLGQYYIVDIIRNTITATHVAPESLARELGVLGDDEALEVSP